MLGKTILIVEDNPANLRLAEYILTKYEFNVLTAQDANAALEILKDSHPDLILMDIQLPGMDGFQFTTLLKKHPATKKIIIIAVTAYAMENDEETALKAGCDGYIAKPFDIHTLPKLVEQFLITKKKR